MLAKNRSLNEIYYKLLLNSPQMITMDIPLKIGKGNISQTKIKHGVILADWKMCYESDMNVLGPVSNEYIQIIFCLNDGISWGMTGNYRSVSIQKNESCIYTGHGGTEYICYKKDRVYSFKSIKILLTYFRHILEEYFEKCEATVYEVKLLNEILGTKYPIIQGGMANIATGEFAAACSNAGALGIIGAGGMNTDTLRENIRRCKQLTDKPFGVNIMLMHPQADEFAKIVVEEGVQVVTTGAGNPGKYVPAWKAAGIKVIPVVAAAVLATHLEPLGIDAVLAEGTESGGHVGEMTTMALVPQVVDAVSVPVIAAGGSADGRQLAAALALGACGVQVGTCLLASEECPIHENYKAALLKAKDSDTIVTGRIGGSPVRVLKNRMSREYVRQEKAGADKMELEKYTLGSLRRAVFEGDTATGSLMAGQVAGMLHEVRPVADILDDLWNSGRQRIAALNEEC